MQGSSRRGTDPIRQRGAALWRRAVIVLGLLLGGPSAALASHTQEAVACVQSLLTQAGHDAGTADGKIGPRTRRALAAWARAQGIAGKVALEPFTAAHWCLRIGQEVPDGRHVWPSLRGADTGRGRRWVDVAVSTELPAGYDEQIETRLNDIYSQITSQLGVETAVVDHVVFAISAAELKRMITARISYPIIDLEANLTRRCGKEQDVVAAASPGIAYFCLREARHLSPDHPQRRLRFVLAHEAMHLVYFQVAGRPVPSDPRKGNRPAHEPIWFLEGIAEVMAYRLTWPADVGGVLRRMRSRYQTKPLPDLAKLEDRAALKSHQEDVYNAGALATALMVEARGPEAIGRLLSAMGEGAPFAAAYEHEFGEPLETLYREFANRAKPVPAKAVNTAGASTSGTVGPDPVAGQSNNAGQDL